MKRCHRSLLMSALLGAALTSIVPAEEVWTALGPTNVGWVSNLAFGDSVAYAATLNGVFRSDDGGASWQPSGLTGEGVVQVATCPGAGMILAIRANPDHTSTDLYASRDQGESWSPITGLPPVVDLTAIDPWHPTTVYASATDDWTTWTIWKSTDSGASWQPQPTSPTGSFSTAFAFDSRVVYIQSLNAENGRLTFYRSADDGASWAPVQSPIENPAALAAGTAPGVVYGAGLQSFCRSADSAQTWTCTASTRNATRIVELPGDGSDAPRILDLASDGVYFTGDLGATWTRAAGGLESEGYLLDLTAGRSDSVALVATSTGIFRSEDRGESWTRSSAGLISTGISSLAIDPRDPSTVWADTGFYGSSSPNLFRSADAGISWSPAGGPGAPIAPGTLVIDPVRPSTLYAGGSLVYRSDDGGERWTGSVLPQNGWAKILAVDPSSPAIWASDGTRLFRSDDGARTWSDTEALSQEIYSLLIDSRNPGMMYAGSYFEIDSGYYGYPSGGSIFVSRDSGASFQKNPHDFGNGVSAIAADPFQAHALYVGTSTGRVFRSETDGAFWEERGSLSTNSAYVLSLLVDPVRPERLYALSNTGVYRSVDGARTWQSLSSGLGDLQVQSLVLTPDGKWLYAGTAGGGVFGLDLTGASNGQRHPPVLVQRPGCREADCVPRPRPLQSSRTAPD